MSQKATVKMFGLLQPVCAELGLSTVTEVDVPERGHTGWELVEHLGLPAEMIEGMFVNHKLHGLGHRVMPADRVAFVPYGTPGPHRLYLGLYEAGLENRQEHAGDDECDDEALI
jgi:hypothetical protein